MAKGSGKVPGSKAFRKYFLRPSILFPSGTKAEMEDGAGEVGRVTEHSLPSLGSISQRTGWRKTSSGCGWFQPWPRLRLGSHAGRCQMC